jgi:hypothetical protein
LKTSSTRPQLEEAFLNGLFPWNTPFSRACYPINLVRSCGSRWQKNPKGLQLNHNHEKFLFFTVLLFFAQFKTRYRW